MTKELDDFVDDQAPEPDAAVDTALDIETDPAGEETPPPSPDVDTETGEPEHDEGRQGEKKRDRTVSGRISEITQQRNSAQAEATRLREQLATLTQKETGSAPKPEEFESQEAYDAAVAKHTYKAIKREEDIEQVQSLYSESEEKLKFAELQAAQVNHDRFIVQANALNAEFPDFQAVMNDPTFHISAGAVDTIKRAENSARIAYHLAKNPAEAARISSLDPVDAAMEIGRIDSMITRKRPAGKPTTNAPAPISPVTGGGSVQKDAKDMTPEEYQAARRLRIRGAKPLKAD